MKISIEVSNWFKKYTGGQTQLEIDVQADMAASKAVSATGIPEEEIGIIIVNGTKVSADYTLKEGDRIKAFPLIIGG